MNDTLFIDGKWVPAHDGAGFAVTNPADDTVLGVVADGSAVDAALAVEAAGRAQLDWAATSIKRRTDLLRGLAAAVTSATEELADLISAESGKPLAEARGELAYGTQFLTWFADQASQALHGEYYVDPEGKTRILTSRRPVGPAYLITPWNFPYAMITRKLAPALAAGCTVIVKPAEQTPLSAVRLFELLEEQGLPEGVANLVTTTRAREVSSAVFDSTTVRKVSFTGSTAVGSELIRASADRVMKLSMELGGNAPFIVFDDAAPQAVDEAVVAKLRNGGQSCIAANRFLVQEDSVEQFTEQLVHRFAALSVGDGRAPGTDVGPVIDRRAVAKLDAMVEEAVSAGARVVHRAEVATRNGSFYPPTVLVDVPPTCSLYRDEIFGPVATITAFADEAEAVRMAEDVDAGLAAYVFTADLERALRVGAALEFGIVGVNRGFVSTAAAPFGGFKTSGLGREGGLHGLDDFVETQYVALPVASPLG